MLRIVGHVKDGHSILRRGSILAPTKVLILDPCLWLTRSIAGLHEVVSSDRIPGQTVASSNEVTLNTSHCWECTNVGLN